MIFEECAFKIGLPKFELRGDTLVGRYEVEQFPTCTSLQYPNAFIGSLLVVGFYRHDGPIEFEPVYR